MDNNELKQENNNNTEETKKGISKSEIILKEIFYYVRMFAIVFLISYIVKDKIIVNANVPTSSMESTIMAKDRVFGNRLAYINKELQRGDIVIFYAPDETDGTVYIKRLIGLPGEKVTISDAKIYINDSETPLREDYLNGEWISNNDGLEYIVPENAYFFMGDNRNSSWDARFWKNTYVNRDAILAKAECIYYPFKNMKMINKCEY